MSDLALMAERIAEARELEDLRTENRRLKAELAALLPINPYAPQMNDPRLYAYQIQQLQNAYPSGGWTSQYGGLLNQLANRPFSVD